MDDLGHIERMTFYEYALRMKARRLKAIDREYAWHRQAWINRQVKAEKKKGKSGSEYVYKRFDRFFDYEKLERAVDKAVPDAPEVSDTASRYMAYLKGQREENP